MKNLSRYSKLIPVLAAVLGEILNAGLVSGQLAHYLSVAIAVLGAVGVFFAPKNLDPDAVPKSTFDTVSAIEEYGQRLLDVENSLPALKELMDGHTSAVTAGIVAGLQQLEPVVVSPVPVKPSPYPLPQASAPDLSTLSIPPDVLASSGPAGVLSPPSI